MTNITPICFFADDLSKKIYRKKQYYTVVIEQDVMADSKEEAEEKFLEGGGIAHDEITSNITDEREGVETYYVDANFSENADTKLVGKVVYEDDEFAKGDGMVELDPYASEDEEDSPIKDYAEEVLGG